MAPTACLDCLVSTVSGHSKNTLRRATASSGHISKLEQSTFLRYLWLILNNPVEKKLMLCTERNVLHKTQKLVDPFPEM